MEKISRLDKVTNEEVLRRVNCDKYLTLFGKGNPWFGHVLRNNRLA